MFFALLTATNEKIVKFIAQICTNTEKIGMVITTLITRIPIRANWIYWEQVKAIIL